jgi:6-phosphogluconolactonase (cycloisomerase 2 family)
MRYILLLFTLPFLSIAQSFTPQFQGVIKDSINGVRILQGITSCTPSPDGKNVYVTSARDSTISIFTSNTHSGQLTLLQYFREGYQSFTGIEFVTDFVLNTNATKGYSLSENGTICCFNRDLSDGSLNLDTVIYNSTDIFQTACDIVLSPNDKFMLIASWDSNTLSIFQMNSVNGRPEFIGYMKDDSAGIHGLAHASSVVISKENKFVYVTSSQSNSVSWYKINESQNTISFLGILYETSMGVDGLKNPRSLILSPDNRFVYVAATSDSAISCFSRDSITGGLNYRSHVRNGIDSTAGLYTVRDICISDDGDYLFSISFENPSICWFKRDILNGILEFKGRIKDTLAVTPILRLGFAISLNNISQQLYVGSYGSNALSWYSLSSMTSVENSSNHNLTPSNKNYLTISPNPITSFAKISFSTIQSGKTSLRIYDQRGKLIETLLSKTLHSGTHSITLNQTKYAAGVYIVKLSTPTGIWTSHVVKLK